MNLPHRITLPDRRPSTYPCESINKVVCEETIPQLTSAERRSAYAEIGQALFAVQSEIQLANKRSELPHSDLSYRAMDYRWLGKARRLRAALSDLLWIIRHYERDLAPRAIEIDSAKRRQAAERRTRRQQHYIDAFTDLVAAEVGEKRLIEMLMEAGMVADRWTEEGPPPRGPGAVRQAMNY